MHVDLIIYYTGPAEIFLFVREGGRGKQGDKFCYVSCLILKSDWWEGAPYLLLSVYDWWIHYAGRTREKGLT